MNNEEFITRETAMTLSNTEFLYGTAISIDTSNLNNIKKLAEEVITVIEKNTGEEFKNFTAAVNTAIPTVMRESQNLQLEQLEELN